MQKDLRRKIAERSVNVTKVNEKCLLFGERLKDHFKDFNFKNKNKKKKKKSEMGMNKKFKMFKFLLELELLL